MMPCLHVPSCIAARARANCVTCAYSMSAAHKAPTQSAPESQGAQRDAIATAAANLEAAASALGGEGRRSEHRQLAEHFGGTWRLLYSSAFEGGNLGGSRPGPPASIGPQLVRCPCFKGMAMLLVRAAASVWTHRAHLAARACRRMAQGALRLRRMALASHAQRSTNNVRMHAHCPAP